MVNEKINLLTPLLNLEGIEGIDSLIRKLLP